MNLIKYISTFIAVFSLVKELVQQFEVPGHGSEKQQAVLNAVGIAYDTAENFVKIPISKQEVLDLATKLIDAIVAFYNAIGKFVHGSPAEAKTTT